MFKKIISKLRLVFIPCEKNKFRPQFLESKFLLCYILVLFFLKMLTIPFLFYFRENALFADVSKSILIELTNKNRQAEGIQPLKENQKLNEMAYFKAKDMIEKGYFSHYSPTGVSPWHWFKKGNYNYQFAGENLAIGFLDSEELFQGWMNSLSHKKNILNPNYQEIGIAIVRGNFQGADTTLVVQFLGSPQKKSSFIKTIEDKKVAENKENKKIAGNNEEEPSFIKTTENKTIPPEVMAWEQQNEEKIAPVSASDLASENKMKFNFFVFLNSDYQNLLQKIIYGSLFIIILCLIINIFVKIDIQHKDLILKTMVFISLLVLFIVADKSTIIKMIPHNFSIY